MPTIEKLTESLSGTQCTQCGYPSCKAYATAILEASAPTNLCRPGGQRVADVIQQLIIHPTMAPAQPPLPPQVALVQESACIGCTLCTQACPTGAIVGAPKHLHTILTDMCTGCGLCLPPCPTDCITLTPAPRKHALTQQLPDGSLTPAASAATWSLVLAHSGRSIAAPRRIVAAEKPAAAALSSLPPELAAKIHQARTRSAAKYAAKGPIRSPRALKGKVLIKIAE